MGEVYRKIKYTDTWHFCSNCSNWPRTYYDEINTPPADGKMCEECKAKESTGGCK